MVVPRVFSACGPAPPEFRWLVGGHHIVVNDSSDKHSYELMSLMSGQKGKLSLSHSVISYP